MKAQRSSEETRAESVRRSDTVKRGRESGSREKLVRAVDRGYGTSRKLPTARTQRGARPSHHAFYLLTGLATLDPCRERGAAALRMAAESALALSALVLVSGPDPKLAKAAPRAFYLAADGRTTISTSGVLPQVHLAETLWSCLPGASPRERQPPHDHTAGSQQTSELAAALNMRKHAPTGTPPGRHPAAPCRALRAVAGRRRAVPRLSGRPLPGAARAQRPPARIAARAGARDQVPRARCRPPCAHLACLPSQCKALWCRRAPGLQGPPRLARLRAGLQPGAGSHLCRACQDRAVSRNRDAHGQAPGTRASAVQARQEAVYDARVGARMRGRPTGRGQAGGAARQRQRQWQVQGSKSRLRACDRRRPARAGWRCGAAAPVAGLGSRGSSRVAVTSAARPGQAGGAARRQRARGRAGRRV